MSLGYDMVYLTAVIAASPLLAWRLLRTGKWRTDWSGRLGQAASKPPGDDRPTLLIHAVSVGEVDATRQLVEQLEAQKRGQWRLVIASTTDTGFARAAQLYSPRHQVVRYPLDFGPCVRRFLEAVQPNLTALVELELWPNFVVECGRREIPVCVINGRLSPRSFSRYRLVRPLLRPTFSRLSAAAVQTPDYAQRFQDMGVPADRVHVTDTMKWDTARIVDGAPGMEQLAAALGVDRGRPLIVAGSTGPGEEQLLLDACPPDAQLMLVPRRPERFDEVYQLASQVDRVIRRTQCPNGSDRNPDGTRLFLLDTMGELGKAYALADVAIVGRSFLPGMFGSNVLESIALGKPTITGPHHGNFSDVVEALREAGGIEVTANPGELCAELLANANKAAALAERGRNVILLRQGATQRHVELLTKLMPSPN